MNEQPATEGPLTTKELLALEMIVEGRSDGEIASALGVELDGVRAFIEEITAKMNAPSPLDAAVRALREGLIGPGTDSFLRRSQT